MKKSELRTLIRSLKAQHPVPDACTAAQTAAAVARTSLWQSARVILLYHALPDEPDLQSLLDQALAEGKQPLLPVVVGDDLVLRSYQGPDSLRPGAFRILEPTGPDFPPSRYAEIDLALVPGMAFDPEGHRLGRGRGYYDRLLPRLSRAYRLGICFPFQLLPSVPCEPHDVVMDDVMPLK